MRAYYGICPQTLDRLEDIGRQRIAVLTVLFWPAQEMGLIGHGIRRDRDRLGRAAPIPGVLFFPGPNIVKEVPQMAKAGARVKITLRCNECKQRNYNTMKNKKNTPDRLEMNKYCPFCRKHTVHSETK